MDTSHLVEAAARAYEYASDMNIKYDESLDEDEDEDFDLDDDIQMSFKLPLLRGQPRNAPNLL